MFRSVLIANRGEIALRVARSCRELGVEVIVVHSTADKDSAAVRFADRAVQIGPPAARQSYLNMAVVLEAALRTGAEAIHPGYGFLSENADFADACLANGITFIGPPAAVIEQLGDKIAARQLMEKAGLPLLPGGLTPLEDAESAMALAGDIGFPLIIKAAAGGGGKGMRVVEGLADLPGAYRETRATAQALFGDGRVYLERYLRSARHVEVQILCDRFGGAIHLGTRDCSVQRRHQKLIEEAPAPCLDPETAEQMGRLAVEGALLTGYQGAGTFEFLLDPDGRFYFMEVNCRVQVEHPVTEMVTGIDIVAEQLRIAAGEPLALRQEDVEIRGSAIECRVNAEDPAKDFRPSAGTLMRFDVPGGPFVRVDTHGEAGYRIPAVYDSLLAKVVAWGADRDEARARMTRALNEFRITGPGVATTIPFLDRAIRDRRFAAAEHDTSLAERLSAAADDGNDDAL